MYILIFCPPTRNILYIIKARFSNIAFDYSMSIQLENKPKYWGHAVNSLCSDENDKNNEKIFINL